jgi:hypothetical protein
MCYKTLILIITTYEIVQNSKSEAKKFSFLCTFKNSSRFDARAEKISSRLSLYVQCSCRSPEPEPGEGGGNGLTLSITANMDALRYKLYSIRNV